MKLRLIYLAAITLLAGAGCTGAFNSANVTPTPVVNESIAPITCLAEWTNTKSLEDNLKNNDTSAPLTKIRAAPAPKGATPIGAKLDTGQYAFWLSADGAVITADNKIFSDLKKINLTRLATEKSELVGTMRNPVSYSRPVLELLTNVGILQTFVHVEAKLCLVREIKKDGNYMAVVAAVHTYYTNEQVDDPYKFNFAIDTKSGAMTVERIE